MDFTGLSFEQIKGWGWRQFVHPEDVEENVRRWQHSIETGEPFLFEHRFRRADGAYRWHLSRALPLWDASGRITMWIGSNTDVDEQKRAAEQLRDLNLELERRVEQRTRELRESEKRLREAQKMEAIGRLAGGVAHDFNNLLTVITGNCEFMLGTLDHADSAYEEAGEIRKAAENAAELTSQLLAFGRRQVLQPKVLDLNDVVYNCDRLLRRVIGEHIELILRMEENLGPVYADPVQMQQVIMNLAINARDAMPEGGRLTIQTANRRRAALPGSRQADDQVNYVLLEISDTGSGISPEIQSQIFEPFFTTKEPGKGTGLGLATVHGIVTQSGGEIDVISEPGKGATFKVYLPQTERRAGGVPAEGPVASGPYGSETVLVVEDDDAVRRVVCRVLRQKGYRVLEARDVADARSVARNSRRVDLLVSDVIMPGGPGLQVARLVTSIHPEAKVLFMSGYSDQEIVRRGIAEAHVSFLQKPFAPAVLAAKVREVLDRPAKQTLSALVS
jgi:PAS domain S-box-containing protein